MTEMKNILFLLIALCFSSMLIVLGQPSDPTSTPTVSILDDAYIYDDDGLRVSKYWSKTVITTFLVFFAFTWLLDMLGAFDQFINSKSILANHRMRLETGKLELEDEDAIYTDGDLPDTITGES